MKFGPIILSIFLFSIRRKRCSLNPERPNAFTFFLLIHFPSAPFTVILQFSSTMASLGGPTNPFPPSFTRRTQTLTRIHVSLKPDPQPSNAPESCRIRGNMVVAAERRLDPAKMKEIEYKDRKEETNRKIASQKAISIILRREAMQAVIEKKKGGSKKLSPKTVLDALHERITALRWESALKVCCLILQLPFIRFLISFVLFGLNSSG